MTAQPPYPPDGAYAIEDPELPGLLSYWVIRGNGLEAWPIGSDGKYGPPRPPKTTPGGSPEQRKEAMRFWRARVKDYRDEVLLRIAHDPARGAARFVENTGRCHRCRAFFHAETLPDSAVNTVDVTR